VQPETRRDLVDVFVALVIGLAAATVIYVEVLR
jgi:hypothetical protein